MDGPLDPSDRQTLLQIARLAVRHAAESESLPPLQIDAYSAALRQDGCAFVTLTRGGALRGCIGGLEVRCSLVEDVWHHAYAAAREDPRFEPVTPPELAEIRIEVSRLTPARPLDVPPDRITTALRPGLDGVIMRRGLVRATFLPQVWGKVPDPVLFLDMLADKAGLPRRAWRHGEVEIQVYQVESFEDPVTSNQ